MDPSYRLPSPGLSHIPATTSPTPSSQSRVPTPTPVLGELAPAATPPHSEQGYMGLVSASTPAFSAIDKISRLWTVMDLGSAASRAVVKEAVGIHYSTMTGIWLMKKAGLEGAPVSSGPAGTPVKTELAVGNTLFTVGLGNRVAANMLRQRAEMNVLNRVSGFLGMTGATLQIAGRGARMVAKTKDLKEEGVSATGVLSLGKETAQLLSGVLSVFGEAKLSAMAGGVGATLQIAALLIPSDADRQAEKESLGVLHREWNFLQKTLEDLDAANEREPFANKGPEMEAGYAALRQNLIDRIAWTSDRLVELVPDEKGQSTLRKESKDKRPQWHQDVRQKASLESHRQIEHDLLVLTSVEIVSSKEEPPPTLQRRRPHGS